MGVASFRSVFIRIPGVLSVGALDMGAAGGDAERVRSEWYACSSSAIRLRGAGLGRLLLCVGAVMCEMGDILSWPGLVVPSSEAATSAL